MAYDDGFGSPFSINDFYDDPSEQLEALFDQMPTDAMTEGMIEAALEMVQDYLDAGGDWLNLYDDFIDDFWEWFRENYNVD